MAAITPNDTLVLMPCGEKKAGAQCEFFDLYNGPLWQTLRLHLGAIPRENVCVLSAEYGFVNGRGWGQPYNRRLSKEAADYAIARGVMARNTRFGRIQEGCTGPSPWVESHGWERVDRPYTAVIQAGAGHYGRVLESYVRAFEAFKAIAKDHWTGSLNNTGLGIGSQRSALAKYLDFVNQ